jgi:hypothetical protein
MALNNQVDLLDGSIRGFAKMGILSLEEISFFLQSALFNYSRGNRSSLDEQAGFCPGGVEIVVAGCLVGKRDERHFAL